MAVRASNMAYLKGITSRMREIPRDVAIDVAFHLFTKLVIRTTVDSGQAALNWHIESYTSTPSIKGFKTYWGTNRRSPSGGAGYKAWFSYLGPTGDPNKVYSTAHDNGVNAVVAMRKRKFDGISVYNPIKPGLFQNSSGYEANAINPAITGLSELTDTAFYRAYARAKAKYPDLL
jgi:hypothetical protein